MLKQVNDLNISYEPVSRGTMDDWLTYVTSLREDAVIGILGDIGYDLSDVKKRPDKWKTTYDVENPQMLHLNDKVTKDDLKKGIMRMAAFMVNIASGSPERWQSSVLTMADWYVRHIPTYSQSSFSFCSLTGRNVRWDCSGFVTACLQLYGVMTNSTWIPSSSSYINDNGVAKKMQDGGFKKMPFSSWEDAQPFDIIVKGNHIEIYAGVIGGRKMSYAWGNYHSKLPTDSAYGKSGYDYIWRCEGGGMLKFNDRLDDIVVNLKGISDKDKPGIAKTIYQALTNIGCSQEAVLGILANIMEESSLDYTVMTWDGNARKGIFGIGGGLCGFYFYGRLKDLARNAEGTSGIERINNLNERVRNSGLPKPNVPVHSANTKHIRSKFGAFPFTLQQQVKYLCDVINTQFSAIKTMKSATDAAFYWENKYEVPANPTDRWAKWGGTIIKYLKA